MVTRRLAHHHTRTAPAPLSPPASGILVEPPNGRVVARMRESPRRYRPARGARAREAYVDVVAYHCCDLPPGAVVAAELCPACFLWHRVWRQPGSVGGMKSALCRRDATGFVRRC